MDVSTFTDHLQSFPDYGDQIVHREVIPARPPVYKTMSAPLNPVLEELLNGFGVTALYAHQVEALEELREGRNIIVATGPASGKSLCYQVPVLESSLVDSTSRALFLFPTKALAQDQLRSLKALCGNDIPVRAEVFDGDTPTEVRSQIKRSAEVLITNPDMLHLGILPNHRSWSRLFRDLRYVVIDETHVYRGVFGSHMSNVIRRLRRLCAYYGTTPQFVLCSATIANPKQLANDLVGLPFTEIREDGSPFGGKQFLFWNPPITDESKSVRRSATAETSSLFNRLLQQRVRTMAFTRTRRQVEMVYIAARQHLAEHAPHLVHKISPYRASYLPEDRRRIEQELFNGELLGVASTNALELGIDVGSLDATVIAGYPGSIGSTWQQAGRSGRRQEDSLTVLVARNDPLDQYLMRHPDFFFGRTHEHALISPGNPYVLDPHLVCAAYEAPLTTGDADLFGQTLMERLDVLENDGLLRRQGKRWFPSPGTGYPAEDVNIRSNSRNTYALVERDSGRVLEHLDEAAALSQLHAGAVYLHYGQQYLVNELNLDTRTAYASAESVTYYTHSRDITDIEPLRILRNKKSGHTNVFLGEVEVSTQIVSFHRKAHFTDDLLGDEVLDLPPQRFPTVALWFDVPEPTLADIKQRRQDLAGGLHAAEHAAIGVLPLFALCDRNDIGGVSTPLHPDTGKPQVFIYDGHAGGIGIAEKGYEIIEELWTAALRVIQECACDDGCPGCVQSPKCGNNNHPLDKQVAVTLLRSALGLD